MRYDVRVSLRATATEEKILQEIRRKNGANTLSEAVRIAIAVAGEALEVASTRAERREETVHV